MNGSVNVPSKDDTEYLPKAGGYMTGPIDMGGQPVKNVKEPTEDGDAVNWGSVKNFGKAKAGFIYPLASAVVPEGFLLCDGAAYSRTEYPELFAAVGTMYGSGDGSTTFNVPDLQKRVPVGAGEGYELGNTGGEAEHTLTETEMPSHRHVFENIGLGYLADATLTNAGTFNMFYQASGSNLNVAKTGGSQPHNNMQPYTVFNYIIATGKNTALSVADIVLGAQAIPLAMEYGGLGAADPKTARENLEVAQAIESADHPGCYYRIVDGMVEWFNPPMVPGVEYRTTERHNDKPVYVKLLNCGAGANNTEKKVLHGAESAIVFDSGGYQFPANSNCLPMPYFDYVELNVTGAEIIINTKADYSTYTAFVWLKYYKYTD